MLGSQRDQAFLRSFGSPPPVLAEDHVTQGHVTSGGMTYLQRIQAAYRYPSSIEYIDTEPEIAKAYVIHPTNQGQRAAIAQRQSMMFDPRNSPSRSQYSQGYTEPAQNFQTYNTYNTPAGLSSKGKRATQPSLNHASPFSRLPITTRMPWDV